VLSLDIRVDMGPAILDEHCIFVQLLYGRLGSSIASERIVSVYIGLYLYDFRVQHAALQCPVVTAMLLCVVTLGTR